jgi:4-amino-4-deoxy-L-arabinose transferase-like glycosyltransferase
VAILLVVLPALALTVIRSLAVAAAGGAAPGGRRTAAVLFAVAAVNFACWALITPPFQAPDEVDHFAYTQSLVERGVAPTRLASSPLPRWSAAENLALEDMSFFTDHQVGDTRPPWREGEQSAYAYTASTTHPSASDGGGNETAASHGPVYYGALAPAYALASSSPLDQLTLMRLASALIGALAVLFAYLLARELAPRRPWLAIAVAALVAYQPMYGFISGAVNNDVGVNAAAAALELLLILLVRRGFRPALALLAGAVLLALPAIKGTAYSLYPVAAIALLATSWRHRVQIRGWALFAAAAAAAYGAVHALASALSSSASEGAGSAGPGAASGAVSEALAHPLGYAAYVWQVFLPRLPGMTRHFEAGTWPAYVIFVERGFGAFGWYDVFFSGWVYVVICAAMLAVLPLGLLAARREWSFVRANAVEAALLLLMPLAVVAGVEAAFYTTGMRPVIAEFGRYAFPAIVPLAVLVVAALHAFPRRWVLPAATALVTAMVTLSYAAQLVTLTGFYA